MAMIERQFDDEVQGNDVDIEFLGGGSLAPALAEQGAAATSNRSSPIVGMRGGLEGPGAAAEPIRGLAAFGSHGSVQDSSSSAVSSVGRYQHHHHPQGGGEGPGGSSPISSTRPPAPDETQGAVAGGEINGAAVRRGSGTEGGGENTSGREKRTNSSNSAQRSGARSNSPYRGGGGVSRTPGQGASSPGAGRQRENPGYRVLQWSELSKVTYMTMGAMCEIYSAELDGVKVAVKIPRKDCEEPAVAEHDLEVELDVLKRVSHKHILGLIGAGNREQKPHRFLVLEDGNMTGFVGECFHVFNKHASSSAVKPYFETDEMRCRRSVLLLGDSLGDLNMAKGLSAEETLTVGFLNDKVEERTDAYLKAYDVVILGDGSFDFVLELLEEVASKDTSK